MAAKKTTKKAPAKKTEKKATPVKQEGSILTKLDQEVAELAIKVENAAKQVGSDIARGYAVQAAAKMREAEDLLYRGEREDR